MNAFPMRMLTITTEFTNPMARPAPITAGTTSHPNDGWSRNTTAPTIVHRPTVDPSDRSSDPTITTTSAPSASNATELDCTKTLVRLDRVRKYGLSKANVTQMQAKTNSGPAAIRRSATDKATPCPYGERPPPPRGSRHQPPLPTSAFGGSTSLRSAAARLSFPC